MSIDAITLAAPVAAPVEQPSANATSSPSSEFGPPTDPFEVLLAAASSNEAASSSWPLASTNPQSVDQQLVALASSSSTSVAETDTTGNAGAAIVAQAAQYLGVPYVWGGSSPSGFDCSGLTQYVFGELGVALPRTAAAQEGAGTPVPSLAQAQPGDLLFFEPGQNGAPPGEAGHVAIYIGNDQMIAAPETGENVQVQQVPGEPLAIRRITLPSTANSPEVQTPLGSPAGSVQMGNVQVPAPYAGMIEQASAATGTPAPLLAAIVYNESRFDPTALSSAGAEGIAQFMPTTAAAYGVDPFNPSSSIAGAAQLLSGYHAAFGSWTDAVAAYTAGGGAVASAGGIPQDGSTPSYVASALSLAGMAGGS